VRSRYLRYRFLVGPTASGKSAVALALARRHRIEILSLDSMQVYRGMDTLTAKPSREERERVPHHLLDLVDPHEEFDVARWREEAERAAAEAAERGAIPLFVGGTGLYLRVLTHGLLEGAPPDPELRRALQGRVDEEGSGVLHRELEEVDPVAAQRIHPNDAKRVVRALEVYRMTGCPISTLQQDWANPRTERDRRIVGLRWERDVLHRRVLARINAMIGGGLLEEVRRIRDGGGFGREAGKAIGVREALAHLAGEKTLEEMRAAMAKATREFVRRQRNWFRAYPDILWVDVAEGNSPEAIAERVAPKLDLPPGA
jgi:tRNA dimethylallyltransferase